jgi:UDPglucose 6-dehydrogenase
LADVDAVNQRRRERVVVLAEQELGSLTGKTILMLGAAFKPDSDDLRDSPALGVALKLAQKGAHVVVHDPMSLHGIRESYPQLTAVDDLLEAAKAAELVILGTEWKQYREQDPVELANAVSVKTVIDGRNALPYQTWQDAGWKVIALGRNLENA